MPKATNQGQGQTSERASSNRSTIVPSSFSPITILISIFTLISAILIAYFFVYASSAAGDTDTDTANVKGIAGFKFPFSRLLGTRQAQVQVPVRPLSSSSSTVVPQGKRSSIFKNLGVEDLEGLTMRTPVYFLSHGGVGYHLPLHSLVSYFIHLLSNRIHYF